MDVRFGSYLRASTDKQGRSGLGLEAKTTPQGVTIGLFRTFGAG